MANICESALKVVTVNKRKWLLRLSQNGNGDGSGGYSIRPRDPQISRSTKNERAKCLLRVSIRDTISSMIKSFRHNGLQRFFETGSKAGIQATHAVNLRLQLAALDQAVAPEDLSAPSWGLHPLAGDLKGHWAITVNGNWRVVFSFEGADAVLVDYCDYH